MSAVVQSTNAEDAARPTASQARLAKRLILFFLPDDIPQELVMILLRGMSDKIEHIDVNWMRHCAVIEFKNCEDSQETLERMKEADNKLGEKTVSVDYCSQRLYEHFCMTKLRSLAAQIEARRSADTRRNRNVQNRNENRQAARPAQNNRDQNTAANNDRSDSWGFFFGNSE